MNETLLFLQASSRRGKNESFYSVHITASTYEESQVDAG